jgi:hypothetical protein
MSKKVVALTEKKDDARMWMPADALREALDRVENHKSYRHVRKAFIVLMDDESDDQYDMAAWVAGMTTPEIICMLECVKERYKEDLGF